MKNPGFPTLLGCLAISLSSATADPKPVFTQPAPRPLTAQEAQKLDAARRATIQAKLRRIIVPTLQFEDTTVEEAIDFLRIRSVELDTTEQDPAKKGVNFVIVGAKGKDNLEEPGKRRINELQLKNIPLEVALKYICELAGLHSSIDAYSVTIRP